MNSNWENILKMFVYLNSTNFLHFMVDIGYWKQVTDLMLFKYLPAFINFLQEFPH